MSYEDVIDEIVYFFFTIFEKKSKRGKLDSVNSTGLLIKRISKIKV
jgi:hypothetical protein